MPAKEAVVRGRRGQRTQGAESKTATIERIGSLIVVRPAIDALKKRLQTERFGATPDAKHGIAIAREPIARFDSGQRLGQEALVCCAGHIELVRQVLREAGCEVREPKRPRPLAEPNLANIPGKSLNYQALTFVQQNERGIIQCAKPSVWPSVIGQVARAWPDLSIVVWVHRLADGELLARKLTEWEPDTGLCDSGHQPSERSRIMVATYRHLSNAPIRLQDRNLAFILDADECFNRTSGMAMAHARKARIYGFRHDMPPRAASLIDNLQDVFGSARLTLPRRLGYRLAPVSVTMLPVRNGPGLSNGLDTLTLKRRAVWHYEGRNRRIAQLARAIVRGDQDWLRRTEPKILAALPHPVQRVEIQVENDEHALALAELLPSWPVMRQGQEIRDCSNMQRVIVAGSSRRKGGPASVVIQAAVAPARIFEPCDPDRPGPCGSYLFIDFDDRFHFRLRQLARDRVAAYRSLDWQVT